jgi:3D (Asp-Asp-Asp) domain-containing protein
MSNFIWGERKEPVSTVDEDGLSYDDRDTTPEEMQKSKHWSIAMVAQAMQNRDESWEVEGLEKAGPYIGPKGGKWKDPEHKIPWEDSAKTIAHAEVIKPKGEENARQALAAGKWLSVSQTGLEKWSREAGKRGTNIRSRNTATGYQVSAVDPSKFKEGSKPTKAFKEGTKVIYRGHRGVVQDTKGDITKVLFEGAGMAESIKTERLKSVTAESEKELTKPPARGPTKQVVTELARREGASTDQLKAALDAANKGIGFSSAKLGIMENEAYQLRDKEPAAKQLADAIRLVQSERSAEASSIQGRVAEGEAGKGLRQGAVVSTPKGEGTVARIRIRDGVPDVVLVTLHKDRDKPGYTGTVFPIDKVKTGLKKVEKSMSTTAIDTLTEFVKTDVEPLSKGLLGYGYGMDWANRMGGTPFEVEALQCLKNLNDLSEEREEVRKKHSKPWSERQRMDPVERAKLDKKRDEAEKKCNAKEDAERKRQGDLEKKYLDWRIEQAKEAKKSDGDDGDEVLEKAQPTTTTTQTLIFDKGKFDSAKAKAWASEHDFASGKIDVTGESVRLRQKDPGAFQEGSFRTIEFKEGIKAVIGRPKKTEKSMSALDNLQDHLEKADDGKPGKSLAETSTEELKSTIAEIKYRAGSSKDPGLDKRLSAIQAELKKRGGKTEKSMSSIDQLEEHLEKSDIPTGQRTKVPTGDTGNPEDGGPLAGVGKPAGTSNPPNPDADQDAQGHPTGVPTPKTQDWSLENEARRVFGGLGGTMTPVTKSLEQDRAIAESRLRKGHGDVEVHPYRMSAVHGDSEARIAALSKGGTNEANPRNAIIARDTLCKSCNSTHPAMLTACPNCGDGAISREAMAKSNPGMILDDPRGAPILRPPKPVEDISFKE